MPKLRLLWSSNAFWCNSGYGVQGRSLLPRLAQLPEIGGRENIAMFAWFGSQGGVHVIDGFTIYPNMGDAYGNDAIGAHSRDFGANLVIPLIDAWVLHNVAEAIKPALFCPWLPIDHDPVPQRVLDGIAGAHMPLTYSKWGRDMLSAAGVANTYIPHGVEPAVYKVNEDRDAVRRFKASMTGSEDSHLTAMVAANKGYPDRKAFQVQLRAWAEFAADKPDAWLYLHTEPTTRYGGLDLPALIGSLGIQNRVLFPDRYQNAKGLPPEYLASVYNAADVLLAATMSEGFGIPIIESQACGTPVVVTDFSAMPELVRWGRKTTPLDRIWTPMNAWQAWPDHTAIHEALDSLYDEWLASDRGESANYQEMRRYTSEEIHQEYGWDVIVANDWQPLITRLAEIAPPLDARFSVPVQKLEPVAA